MNILETVLYRVALTIVQAFILTIALCWVIIMLFDYVFRRWL